MSIASRPILLRPLSHARVTALACSLGGVVALTDAGTLLNWELGGATARPLDPTSALGGDGVCIAVACGARHAIAIVGRPPARQPIAAAAQPSPLARPPRAPAHPPVGEQENASPKTPVSRWGYLASRALAHGPLSHAALTLVDHGQSYGHGAGGLGTVPMEDMLSELDDLMVQLKYIGTLYLQLHPCTSNYTHVPPIAHLRLHRAAPHPPPIVCLRTITCARISCG